MPFLLLCVDFLSEVVNKTEGVCVHVRGFASGSVYDQSLIMRTISYFSLVITFTLAL